MKIKFYMEKDNALFSQVTDLEKEFKKGVKPVPSQSEM